MLQFSDLHFYGTEELTKLLLLSLVLLEILKFEILPLVAQTSIYGNLDICSEMEGFHLKNFRKYFEKYNTLWPVLGFEIIFLEN